MPNQGISTPAPGQFRDFISRFEGRQLGAYRRAARLAGLSFDEFVDRLDGGEKRCTKCKAWKVGDLFGLDSTRWDGRDPKCLDCRRQTSRDLHELVPIDDLKPSGPPRDEPRDGDKLQARHLINLDVQKGRRPHPNDLHCSGCGHKGSDRRHEYHHHMGYSAQHHYDVIPLCSTCHHGEH